MERPDYAEFAAARRVPLLRSAVLLGLARADAEDAVQTTLLRCLRSWRRVRRADDPAAYAYRVLVNVVRDRQARRWTGEVPTDDPLTHAPPAGEPDLLTGIAVRRALAALGHDHREVLVLRFYADLSERQTAAVLGVAPGTVKSRTSRALAALAADPDLRNVDAH